MYPQKTNLVDLLMQEQDKNIVPAVNMQPQQMPMPQNNRFKDALFGTGGDIGRALLSGQNFGQALGTGSLGLQQRRQQGEQDVFLRQLLGQAGIEDNIPQNTMVTPDMFKNVVDLQNMQANQRLKEQSLESLNQHRQAQQASLQDYRAQQLENAERRNPFVKHSDGLALLRDYGVLTQNDFEDITTAEGYNPDYELPISLLNKLVPVRHMGGDSNRPDDKEEFGEALAQFTSILQSNDPDKINFARQKFIQHFKVDPYSKLRTPSGRR